MLADAARAMNQPVAAINAYSLSHVPGASQRKKAGKSGNALSEISNFDLIFAPIPPVGRPG
ncbi:hypothetical protein BN871_GA_00070 [Paenibacillus sp. P22]|nr:hypothetical protein BN871_GA_00070 [Paenibacillus sp. P22]